MNWTEYTDECRERGFYNGSDRETNREQLELALVGLVTEAAEALDTLKKIKFHHHPTDKAHLIKLLLELGDHNWYYALALQVIPKVFASQHPLCESSCTPELLHNYILECNLEKLSARYSEGYSDDASLNRKV